jgi:hypothetical protein
MSKKKKAIERENVFLTSKIMTALIEDETPQFEGWEFIEDEINSVDAEDGGGQHYTVLKRLSDERFFKMDWCDWDREDGQYGSGDFMHDCHGHEVTPKTVTKVVYE